MNKQKLLDILEKHKRWLRNEPDGERADLRSADLRSADLILIKEDFFKRLALAKHEVAGLYDYLIRGKVEGSSYQAECACFVGTIAKVAKENYAHLSSGLLADSNSPTEIWFTGISKGDTPESNPISKITCEWVLEFCKEQNILLSPSTQGVGNSGETV